MSNPGSGASPLGPGSPAGTTTPSTPGPNLQTGAPGVYGGGYGPQPGDFGPGTSSNQYPNTQNAPLGMGPGGLYNPLTQSNPFPTVQQDEESGEYGPPDQFYNGIDYTELSQQQNAANRPDTTSQFGSSQQTFNPETGQWTVNNTLAGPGQAEYQEAENLAPGLAQDMTTGLNTADLTAYGTAPTYDTALASSGASDAYGLAMANLQPQQQLQSQTEQASLEAQGLHPGDPAYDQQMNLIAQQQTSADTQAQQAADITGTQMASTQTGAEATAATSADAQRQQQIQEQLTQQGWTANEIAQLLGSPAVTGAPGASGTTTAPAANNTASLTQAQTTQQQLQAQMLNSALSAGTSAGTAGISAAAAAGAFAL
jgi:hypothetical protein